MLIHAATASAKMRDLTSRFTGVRLATPDDAQALARFINETSMNKGKLRIGFNRGDDYFALLRLQGEKFSALVCEQDGQIAGVGALTLRQASVRGRKVTLGYLQDLRMAATVTQRTRQNFYQFFSEFVRLCPQFEEYDNCSLFVTAILDDNRAAKAALSRSAFPLEYTRLSQYTAHMWPKIPTLRRLTGTARMQNSHEDEVSAFYAQELGRRAFDLTTDDLARLKEHSSSVVLKDGGGIVAACLLVQTDQERVLQAKHTGINFKLNAAGTFITALRVAKGLAPERATTAKQQLLGLALRESRKLNGLFTGYIETANDPLRMSHLQNLGSYKTQGSIYRVYHPEHSVIPEFSAGFLRPSHVAQFDWISS